MDRERLKEVQQADLTESKVNEEFVDWLKTSGPTYLLIILVGITGFLGWQRFRQHKQQKATDAWMALRDAALPRSKEDVAAEHAGIFAVPQLALQSGGTQLLEAVQTGQPIDQTAIDDATPDDERPKLTTEERDHYLTRADEMFRRVVDGDDQLPADDGSLPWTLHVVNALNGRAAIAESRGDIAEAKRLYEEAAKRAETFYPQLAEQARQRAATVEEFASEVVLTSASDRKASTLERALRQPIIESSLRDLIFDDDEG